MTDERLEVLGQTILNVIHDTLKRGTPLTDCEIYGVLEGVKFNIFKLSQRGQLIAKKKV